MENSHYSQSHTASWIRGKCVGRGAFGTVNIGFRKSDGEVFAVKSVDLAACLPSQAEALENEIRILRSLSSPYVVKYLNDDHTASFRNLHMEYLPGGTAGDSADVDESVVQSRTWCVVSALKYLHSRGLFTAT
ncbi:putative mitogen-activated protein kinase kinase kinase STE-STE11 family [Rosa chinensis]|uniref:Putative mitogen-activated protein kinase kinase kinase STE-STE11 family n=1 Tax=Rosa chinensis TaxID=74649 RepID=A0A2P6QK61_ROSCH|nr:putative mitogen-activated protein kinase kinase kinase STE-STE11 family [Rosa chinensis]